MGQAGVLKLPEAPVKRVGPHIILTGVGGSVVVDIVVVLVVGGGTVVGVVGGAIVGRLTAR